MSKIDILKKRLAITANRKRYSALGLVEKARDVHSLQNQNDGLVIL